MKNLRLFVGLFLLFACAGALRAFATPPMVTNVTAHQRADASGLVDITYDLFDAQGGTQTVYVAVSTNSGGRYDVGATSFSGAVGAGVTPGAAKHIVWDAIADLPMVSSTTVRVKVTADDSVYTDLFCIVDVAAGPAAYSYPVIFSSVAPPLNDEYKTTKIVLGRIAAGTFAMGSPTNELGRDSDETRHTVTLSCGYYLGLYEITQAQYSNVMGANPSFNVKGAQSATRPAEMVSWTAARGGIWPGGAPDGAAFMGRLRTKTNRAFDLPSEAQWEYACRAGTTNALNNNTNLTNTYRDGNMDLLGRYYCNGGGTYVADPTNGADAAVGSYQPNSAGLYDMHGNVNEWCLDLYGAYGGNATDPAGADAGTNTYRVIRGGSWCFAAGECRSAARRYYSQDYTQDDYGFRLCLPVRP